MLARVTGAIINQLVGPTTRGWLKALLAQWHRRHSETNSRLGSGLSCYFQYIVAHNPPIENVCENVSWYQLISQQKPCNSYLFHYIPKNYALEQSCISRCCQKSHVFFPPKKTYNYNHNFPTALNLLCIRSHNISPEEGRGGGRSIPHWLSVGQ